MVGTTALQATSCRSTALANLQGSKWASSFIVYSLAILSKQDKTCEGVCVIKNHFSLFV